MSDADVSQVVSHPDSPIPNSLSFKSRLRRRLLCGKRRVTFYKLFWWKGWIKCELNQSTKVDVLSVFNIFFF